MESFSTSRHVLLLAFVLVLLQSSTVAAWASSHEVIIDSRIVDWVGMNNLQDSLRTLAWEIPGDPDLFGKYFALEKIIELDETPLIAGIGSLDVDDDGRLLIGDTQVNAVHLFNASGKHLKTLSQETCQPDFQMRPIRVYFRPQGGILVQNQTLGLLFSDSGECLERLNTEFRTPRGFCFLGKEGDMIGSYRTQENRSFKLMEASGKTLSEFEGPTPRLPAFSLRTHLSQQVVCDRSERIYHVGTFDPVIHVYDQTGAMVDELWLQPDPFEPVERDVPEGPDILETIRREGIARDGKAVSTGIYFLNREAFLYVFIHQPPNVRFAFELFSKSGERLVEKQLVTSEHLLMAKGDRIYFSIQPATDNGVERNPAIAVFRYRRAD